METLKERIVVKARKEHTCDYCSKKISVGENYTKGTYKQDFVYDWKECERCKEYVKEAFGNKNYDWSDGMGEQDFKEYMWEEHRDIAMAWWKN